MDIGLIDVEMFQCENGHSIHNGCVPKEMVNDEFKSLIRKISYSMPIEYCPICMFKKIDRDLAYTYLLRKTEMTESSLLQEFYLKYSTFKNFKDSVITK
ncbi:MAG: hypothetical protein WC375_04010 [Methanomassiliicoccales archaeon]